MSQKVWRAKMDDKTCGKCRLMNDRKVGQVGQMPVPSGKCKNPEGCRCVAEDEQAPGLRSVLNFAQDPDEKKTLLWVGDAVVASGFAKSTHAILDVLKDKWNVAILGLNYTGDPHPHDYPIFPCAPGGDGFGINRIRPLVDQLRPDVIVIQNDPWNVPAYLKKLEGCGIPVVGVMPLDGDNCAHSKQLNPLAHAVWWTEHARNEAEKGGYRGNSTVIPLGVDLDRFKPKYSIRDARTLLEMPDVIRDGYIVGNVNRNQPRKRLDLTVSYFAQWVKDFDVRDAFLYLHVSPTGDSGYDVVQLMHYYGLKKRLIIDVPDIGHGVSEDELVATYCSFDAQMSTTQGEGFGLTTLEGFACGVPQIAPKWSALGEWATAARLIPCSETAVTPGGPNVVGGVADRGEFIKALDEVYRNRELRIDMAIAGLKLAEGLQYRWKTIGERFGSMLDRTLDQWKPREMELELARK